MQRDKENKPEYFITTVIDITKRKIAEKLLVTQVRQQSVITELGNLALTGTDLNTLFNKANSQIAGIFEMEFCTVLKCLPVGNTAKLVAGFGWEDGIIGQAIVNTGTESQAGFTMLSKEPVIVEDFRTEKRFKMPPILESHGVVSGISVIIGKVKNPFGILFRLWQMCWLKQ